METTVAPLCSISGQNPETENLGPKVIVPPTSIVEMTPVEIAFR